MKTLILGGGVVGVTTAYFLAKAGHEVTLLEEKDALGLEASSGNAGIIAPGHSFAWASPRAPRMLWESLRGAETAIRIRPTTDWHLYAWGLRFLRECTADRARRNTLIKLRLCQYSQSIMPCPRTARPGDPGDGRRARGSGSRTRSRWSTARRCTDRSTPRGIR